MNVRTKNDLKQWFKFFLVGIIETTKNGIETFDAILKLKKETEEKIQKTGNRSNHILILLDYLYQKPIINAAKVIELTKVSQATAYKIIDELVVMEILKEITGGKRGKIFVFDKYIQLFS
jgi:Fic family protein